MGQHMVWAFYLISMFASHWVGIVKVYERYWKWHPQTQRSWFYRRLLLNFLYAKEEISFVWIIWIKISHFNLVARLISRRCFFQFTCVLCCPWTSVRQLYLSSRLLLLNMWCLVIVLPLILHLLNVNCQWLVQFEVFSFAFEITSVILGVLWRNRKRLFDH